MDYAIVLYFDTATEEIFTQIIKAIANSVHNQNASYMLEHKIPPHITVSFFHADDIDEVVCVLNDSHLGFTAGDIFWGTLGTFVPNVLFAAPVLNEYLLNTCTTINKLLKNRVNLHRFYLPYQWVPHTTLATKLNQDELIMAFDIASKHFTSFGGKSNRIALVECNPYKEVRTWDLFAT